MTRAQRANNPAGNGHHRPGQDTATRADPPAQRGTAAAPDAPARPAPAPAPGRAPGPRRPDRENDRPDGPGTPPGAPGTRRDRRRLRRRARRDHRRSLPAGAAPSPPGGPR
ncbi:hypothetical protein ACFQ1I_17555 [Kitasatospora arboriphila]